MQVLTPQDFSRIIFSATASPQSSSFNPQQHFKSPLLQTMNHPQMFHHPPPIPQNAPRSFFSEAGSTLALNQVDEVKNQVTFLESEVKRMSDELRLKADSSKKERQARDKLTRENESLRSDLSKMKSLLHSRDQQIHELERQLTSSHNQLSLLKRRYMAAVEEARNTAPGTIKNIQKERHSIGVQVDEIRGLEERIYKLTVALKEEKSRNKRVKTLLNTDDSYYENASVPPVPRIPMMRSRGVSVQPVSSRTSRTSPRLTIETIPLAYIHKRRSRLSSTQFMVINCRSIAAPPPQAEDLSGISAIHHYQAPPLRRTHQQPLSVISPISPIYRQPSPFQGRQVSSFEVFQDKDLLSLSPPPMYSNRNGLRDINEVIVATTKTAPARSKPSTTTSSSSYRHMEPDTYDISSPRVPKTTALPPYSNHSSEDAIKRAVAAAVEKRKQLASMGMSVGSKSSSISSFMSDYGKGRFGCFLA